MNSKVSLNQAQFSSHNFIVSVEVALDFLIRMDLYLQP